MPTPLAISAQSLPTLRQPAELRLTRVQNNQWVWRRPLFVNPGPAGAGCDTYASNGRRSSVGTTAETTGRVVDLFV